MDINDQIVILTSPVPKFAGFVRCFIKRFNSGLSEFWFPRYELRLADTGRLLITGKRRFGNWTGNYLLTLDHEHLTTKSAGYIGKLRSNVWGSVYNLFDSGDNPLTVPKTARPRENMGAVMYESKWFKKKGPRRMTVLFPKVVGNEDRIKCVPLQEKDSLIPLYERKATSSMFVLVNKQPRWNDTLKAHVLDFKGRVKRPSVKNFILTDHTGKEEFVVFGRSDDNTFVLDVKWPISLYQAFALGISAIAKKYGCQ